MKIDHDDFTNTNGLVAGRIPMGVECPFKHKCMFAELNECKRPEVMGVNFSCAEARMFSMIENMHKEKKNV